MKSYWIYIICFAAGAVGMMVLLNHCNNQKDAGIAEALRRARDSVQVIVDSNNVLTKERADISLEKILHDSANKRTIDSLQTVIKRVKANYYADTVKFKASLNELQEAFNNRDSIRAQAAIDSLTIEARSANWSATNLFYQYDEMDSVWRLQKAYDDSVYHQLFIVDSSKDSRFQALLNINNQQGKDLETALNEVAKLKKGKKFWLFAGAILGAATNLLHH